MLISRFVVSDDPPLQCLLDGFQVDRIAAAARRNRRRDLECIQRQPGIATGSLGERGTRLIGDRSRFRYHAAHGPIDQQGHISRLQRLEAKQRRPRDQRRVDLEERVLGRGPHQNHHAGLYARQQGVLLRLVEAVDLVEKQDGASLVLLQTVLRLGQHLADVLDAGVDRGQWLERGVGLGGYESGKGRLAGPRRSPQNHRQRAAGADHYTEGGAWSQEMLLPNDLVEFGGSHPGRKRFHRPTPLGPLGGKEIVHQTRGTVLRGALVGSAPLWDAVASTQ